MALWICGWWSVQLAWLNPGAVCGQALGLGSWSLQLCLGKPEKVRAVGLGPNSEEGVPTPGPEADRALRGSTEALASFLKSPCGSCSSREGPCEGTPCCSSPQAPTASPLGAYLLLVSEDSYLGPGDAAFYLLAFA